MGSGATKVNSGGSDHFDEKSDTTTHNKKETNNNICNPAAIPGTNLSKTSTSPSSSITNLTKIRPQSGQDSTKTAVKTKRNSPSLNSAKQNIKSAASKNDSPETKVVTLKPSKLEVQDEVSKNSTDEIQRLNKELDLSESKRIDLQEQIQLLEERLKKQKQTANLEQNANSLQETLNAKDQYIVKLEKEIKSNQADANKTRIKLKKKIKNLTNQLHESRQDSSITQMELRAEIGRQTEQIKILEGQSTSSTTELENNGNGDSHHSKIIVELSNQVSEQAEQISSLETELVEKKKEISKLKLSISDRYDSKDSSFIPDSASNGSMLPNTTTDRLHSSRLRSLPAPGDRLSRSKSDNFNDHFVPAMEENNDLFFSKESTVLSDSDSDWGENPAPSQTHSAPARSRIKSAVTLSSSGKHNGSLLTLNGNDDSSMELMSTTPVEQPSERKSYKSTLKSQLQKTRMDNEMNSLIGPALAFENKNPDPFSDTSCEPTPRPPRTMFHRDSKVRIVKPIVH